MHCDISGALTITERVCTRSYEYVRIALFRNAQEESAQLSRTGTFNLRNIILNSKPILHTVRNILIQKKSFTPQYAYTLRLLKVPVKKTLQVGYINSATILTAYLNFTRHLSISSCTLRQLWDILYYIYPHTCNPPEYIELHTSHALKLYEYYVLLIVFSVHTWHNRIHSESIHLSNMLT